MRALIAILSLYAFSLTLYSQGNTIELAGDYHGKSFTEFVEAVEKQYPIKFYFINEWIDTVTVSQSSEPSTLAQVLEETLKNSEINYTIHKNRVVLTHNYKIVTEFPEWLYKAGNVSKPSMEIDSNSFVNFNKKPAAEEHVFTNGSAIIGDPSKRNLSTNVDISGVVREEETGEPIVGVVVYFQELGIGSVTDINGHYVINVPRGQHSVQYKFIGRADRELQVTVNDGGELNINLKEQVLQLHDVVITADKEHNVRGLEVGLMKLDIKTVKQIPSSLGEADIVKTAILLPGVQTVGEGASGFNVRGGSTDQNLQLIDGSPIYNSSHLFGFFSVYNSDVIKDFKLYKSGIPANYGGRLSSVFDVSVKNGNRKKYSVYGGISPIAGRLTVEGPILKEKASFIISGRSTYSDWLLNRFDDPGLKNSDASFYDLNAKATAQMNKNNSVYITGYTSKDFFKLNSDTTYNYKNYNASIGWKHTISRKLYATLSGIYSYYEYDMSSKENPYSAFSQYFSIDHKEAKLNFAWFPAPSHKVTFGGDATLYHLNPGTKEPYGTESNLAFEQVEKERAFESALYLNDEYKITGTLSVNVGLRYSFYNKLGAGTVYNYKDGVAMDLVHRIDSTVYGDGEKMVGYNNPEFRVAMRYQLGLVNSVKLSYNRMTQYLNMLSNTTAISPVDIWKLSDTYIKPQIGDQFAVGYYHNFKDNTIEASVEVYYKDLQNVLEYKGGAELQMNEAIETDVLQGDGRAYGVELLIKKKYGRLNGWIAYTYSRSQVKIEGDFATETINDGEWFSSNYDKPHDITIVSNYKFSRRFNFSNNFTYSTGRPITYPVAKYQYNGREMLHYSNRNEYRVPDYFRWDMALNINGSLKSNKLTQSMWSFSIYNLTGRKNVYSIYFQSEGEEIQGYKLSVFARPIFTATYNFKF